MGIIDQARDIAELVKKYNDQELYERIVHLREEILRLREENIELHQQVKQLTDAATIEEDLIRVDNCYYRRDDANQKQPYCLTCWDSDRKLISLILGRNRSLGTVTIKCGVCEARK